MSSRKVRSFSPPQESCGGSTALFVLSITLGIALIVVIILIIVYATKQSSTSSAPVDIIAVEAINEDYHKPLVLDGPLSMSDFKRVAPDQVKVQDAKPALKEVQPAPHKAPAPAHTPPPTTAAAHIAHEVTAEHVPALVNNNDGKSYAVAVVADYCGACRSVKKTIADNNIQDLLFLNVNELHKLEKPIKDAMSSGYIPQFAILGPNGAIVKGPTGNTSKEDIEAFIQKAKQH